GARRPRGMVANSGISANRDAARRPARREHLADQVLLRHRPPRPRVAGRAAVVAHHEVVAGLDLDRLDRARVAPARLDVRFVELLAVDVDVARALLPEVSRQADQALDEGPAGAAALPRQRRCLEPDDAAALRAPEAVAD